VPTAVNHRVGTAKRTIDARIEKTAADMIVPFEQFAAMMEVYRAGFEARGLEYAVWGHISDGNVHPNVIPRSYEDVVAGKEAILEFGREVVRLGGCPLAEHGVGRNPVKQELLRQLYADEGIEEMRRVKRALDPGWKLSPGVIFQNP
jgi:D-lactate dehydrogenase (cytochrome)